MKKAIWLLLLATLFACGPSTTATQPTSTDAEEADTFVAEQTSDESEAEPETETETSAPAAADLDDFVPATTVEEAAVIRTQDWRIGATDPLVVIIEYGDFQ